jgi:hypothetical protein
MRYDPIDLHIAAKRARAEAIAGFIGSGFAWLLNLFTREHKPHAARPHFAR